MNEEKDIVIYRENSIVVKEKDIEMVKFYSDGFRNQYIAEKLGLSVRTIEFKSLDLQEKFQCKSIPHLVATFFRKGLIQ